MSVELLFVTHNRLEFTKASFDMLRENTNWDLVDKLHIVDDHSTDGTMQFMQSAIRTIPCAARFTSRRLGGPVAAMNDALDFMGDAEILAKIDSDVIVCPGWLEQMLKVMTKKPRLDCLGMEPGFGGKVAPLSTARGVQPARWIGGVGLIRTRVFRKGRPKQNDRFFGWTSWQRQHCNCGWISPALPVFLLDLLPFEPWMSLTSEYIEKGWQRPLHREPGRYDDSMRGFWDWWLPEEAVKVGSR